jgi:hypothetical protein
MEMGEQRERWRSDKVESLEGSHDGEATSTRHTLHDQGAKPLRVSVAGLHW